MKVINLYKILKYKIQIIIFIAIIIAFILMYIAGDMLFNKTDLVKEDKNIKYDENNFNLNSYYSNSKIKVYSNKNENEYNVTEVYKYINNMSCYIFTFNNEKNGITKYMINGDKIKIENDRELNKFIIPNEYLENNLLSINTYLKLLDKNSKFEEYENNMKKYSINVESTSLKRNIKNIDIIFNDSGLYKIFAFDKEGKLYIDIEINDFKKDYSIDDYEFDF